LVRRGRGHRSREQVLDDDLRRWDCLQRLLTDQRKLLANRWFSEYGAAGNGECEFLVSRDMLVHLSGCYLSRRHCNLSITELIATAALNGKFCGRPTSRDKRANAPNFLYATLDRTACAPSFKERRMKCREPTKLHRKSGCLGHPSPVVRQEEKKIFEGASPRLD
jgi:hypothetical protein